MIDRRRANGGAALGTGRAYAARLRIARARGYITHDDFAAVAAAAAAVAAAAAAAAAAVAVAAAAAVAVAAAAAVAAEPN
jgi:hypothetical protein